MGNIKKDLRAEAGFFHVSENQLSFLFAPSSLISCADPKIHYCEGPKPLNHVLDVQNLMKMPRCVVYNGFVAVVRRI